MVVFYQYFVPNGTAGLALYLRWRESLQVGPKLMQIN